VRKTLVWLSFAALAAGRAVADEAHPSEPTDESEESGLETVVRGKRPLRGEPDRDSSLIGRTDLDERVPRSAPDALRYEPGVFVQQTAHGQGSAYIRGRTGQQTLLLFDGIRLNTSTFRQGPNQYFFTVDARTVRSIEVIRGGASTLYGSDALAGVLYARPLDVPAPQEDRDVHLYPGFSLRGATADHEIGGRIQTGLRFRPVGFFGGVGARRAGLLEGGGIVRNLSDGGVPQVPRLANDGRTQVGTGFQELASDARLAFDLDGDRRVVAAVYDYRQFDAPRTDQCPPAYAALGECMVYAEQFRTLAYVAFEGPLGKAAEEARFTVSYQRQHERRVRDRPASAIVNGGKDDVNTFGFSARLATGRFRPATWFSGRVQFGGDLYHDRIGSTAWLEFTDTHTVVPLGRGQYLDGSHYTTGGGFAAIEGTLFDRVTLKTGARLGGSHAYAPADPESGSARIERSYPAWSAFGIARFDVSPALALILGVDRSFRTPNLDDLTSRQQTGPGYQFENSSLGAESAVTLEAGVQVSLDWLDADLWAYRSALHDAIERSPRDISECPKTEPQCASSWSRYRLVNLRGEALIWGFDAALMARLPLGFYLRSTLAWAWGEGPNPGARPSDPTLPWEERVPLSRIPPLNGTVEVRWAPGTVAWLAAGLRWATAQTRLSLGDRSDARIPQGGTPGFAVLDLRAGLRVRDTMRATVVFENVTDAAYRYHGSSVNGPGVGVVVEVAANF